MSKKTISGVVGAAIATSLAGAASAAENPFAVKDLASGYMQVAEAGKETKEMVCGEGKCGAKMMKSPEMNCGAMKAQAEKEAAQAQPNKAMEGKCAGMKMDQSAPASAPTPAPAK